MKGLIVSESEQTKYDDITDQRYFPRWEVKNRALFQVENQKDTFEAQTVDLSCAGVCLQTAEPVQINQKLKLIIYLSPSKFINVDGTIAWIHHRDGHLDAGVHFKSTHYKTQDTILQYAFEVRHDQVIRHWFKGWKI